MGGKAKSSKKSIGSAKGKVKAPAKKAAAKVAPKKAAVIAKPVKKVIEKVIEKKEFKSASQRAADKRRSQAAAAMKAALDESSENSATEEEEFDPAAFFAASGGQGIFRAHVMRKERVDLAVNVRYRFLTGPLVFNADMLNLSKGGLCLKTVQVVKPKTVLKIEIPLPHTSELFTVQAECVWSDPIAGAAKGDSNPSMTGLKFMAMSLAKQTVINNFIQQRRDEIIMAKIGLDKFTDSVPVAGLD